MLSRNCGKLKHEATLRAYTTPRSKDYRTSDEAEDVADSGESCMCLDDKVMMDTRIEDYRKESAYKLTMKGLSNLTGTLRKKLAATREKRDEYTDTYEDDDAFEDDDDDFFVPTAHLGSSSQRPSVSDEADGQTYRLRQPSQTLSNFDTPRGTHGVTSSGLVYEPLKHWQVKMKKSGNSVIRSSLIESVEDNSVRRLHGVGYLGKFFDTKHQKQLTQAQQAAFDHFDDNRPFFTYWVTFVQVVIMIITLYAYGFGPIGATRTQVAGLVLVPSLSLQQVDYFEPDNLWLGPRAADLIHLGAKYAPCMRRDELIYREIERERFDERDTACCIRNDESGCVQTKHDKCSPLLSTWSKWMGNDGPLMYKPVPRRRTSGTVCGQDPRFCEEPPSQVPYEWPDDITKWPKCTKKMNRTVGTFANDKHMSCEIVGRPCCTGIHGECRITTQEYCDFVKGTFHEEASLCSQVSCMDDICGMIPFYSTDTPDQFYRLWTSLFLHAGLLHLIPTILIQLIVMKDMEKLIGSSRIAAIYLISGTGGNLASSIFVPYRAEVGPAGAHFGLLACMMIEIFNSWDILENPRRAVWQYSSIAIGLFLCGLLPWIDNYAHITGFLVGLLASLVFVPYNTVRQYSRRTKVLIIWTASVTLFTIYLLLLLIFYVFPVYNCPWCKYVNCIPFTENWCASQDIEIKRVDVL
ncbi:Inactive rhomboid protein 2 [Halotydeus destructor]|nr:Inactive rhomboid protein 2 [Halotydeus destructor]